MKGPTAPRQTGDLSVTALYTSQAWAWGGLSHAHLFATTDAKRVFDATNAALGAASIFKRGFVSLKHSLLHRHTMFDHLLRTSGARQVLELAAGLSRRGAAFSEDPELRYTEVDLPHVVEKKRTLLERTDEGRSVLARPNLRLVEGDVTTADLASLVEPGRPVFVIAEGLTMYFKPEAQRALWTKVRDLVSTCGDVRFVFDLVPTCEEPAPGAIGRTLEAAMKRFTGGKSFERDSRTRDQIVDELQAIGFANVELFEPATLAASWKLPYPEVPSRQLLFSCSVQSTRA